MSAQQPAYTMGGLSHSAELFRRASYAGWCKLGGIFHPTDLDVTAPGGMFIAVGSGEVLMPGGSTATQGLYYGLNDATVTLGIASSDPTNPRYDLVCATAKDANYSGGTTAWVIQVITGTPSSSPAVPALPSGSVPLKKVFVGATVSTIVPGNLTFVGYLTSGADPIGTIKAWTSSIMLPAGYVDANGQSLTTANFPDAFKLWGYQYGGSGSNFSTPNTSGRVLVGQGSAGWTNYIFAGAYGSEVISGSQLPSHTHGASQAGHFHTPNSPYEFVVGDVGSGTLFLAGSGPNHVSFDPIGTSSATPSVTVNSAGSSGNYQIPSLAVRFIVRVQ